MTARGTLRVAVVGGGIGGMTTAIALQRHGVAVTVYEQAPELGEIGAGVFITPNGMRSLGHLGLADAAMEVGGRVGDGSSYYRMDGTYVGPILTTDSEGWNGVRGMHRADLLGLLSGALSPERVRTDHTCVEIDQSDEAVRLRFDNGEVAAADVVIGADGIHSVVRAQVTEPSQPVHSGSVAYRGLLPAERLPDWRPEVSQLWMGEGKHFLVYPVRRGELINYVGFVPTAQETRESWSAMGDPAELAAAFRGWDPAVEGLLDQVETTFWWGLYDREPLERWTAGRVTLLGDAAHPMLPHLGQGANQAMEDAIVLGEVLGGVDRDGVTEALQRYEDVRRPRTTRVQLGARDNGRRYDSDYEDLSKRDDEIRVSRTFRLELYDYDAVAMAGGAAAA